MNDARIPYGFAGKVLPGATSLFLLAAAGAAQAHDPVFGPGPHVLYQGGHEVHTGWHRSEAGAETEDELALELAYGITGDWVAGVELPYARVDEGAHGESGVGDVGLFSKYRFWRNDSLGVQESAAIFGKVTLPTGDETAEPALGGGATDTVIGVTYGYESLKWYRWAGLRYRFNDGNDAGLDRGDRVMADLAVGWRPSPPEYREPDTVWLLELNGEYTQRAELRDQALADTGGVEWFVSPGIFWTYRNFAVKAGVQLLVASNLFGEQDDSDYRAQLELEWHF